LLWSNNESTKFDLGSRWREDVKTLLEEYCPGRIAGIARAAVTPRGSMVSINDGESTL
jgi:hypothetical protein